MLIALVSAKAQSTAPSYAFTHLAGSQGGWGNADGTGIAARFWNPTGVAIDSAGNTYVADTSSGTIRKISSGGVVTTLTTLTGIANVPGLSSFISYGGTLIYIDPTGLAVDSTGTVYVANHGWSTILKIAPGGVVTTLAGGIAIRGTANGTGTAARFNNPNSVALDSSGNVFVADSGNHLIRRITSAGVVSTLAGTASVAGNADGVSTSAQFSNPQGVAVDNLGNVYVADTNNHTVRKISSSAAVTTVAGTAGVPGTSDGIGTLAQFNSPTSVAVDSIGNIYVADQYNQTVRKITPGGLVTTLAGTMNSSGSANGTGQAAQFNSPTGVAVDSTGNVIVADQQNCMIRKIAPNGTVTTLAGNAPQLGHVDGTGTAARFFSTTSATVDTAGNLYVSEIGPYGQGLAHMVRKITAGGIATTLATIDTLSFWGYAWSFDMPTGIAVDSTGNVYVTNWFDHTIRKVTPAGSVAILAGTTGIIGSADGTGTAAQFNYPTGLALDQAGNLFVADQNNRTIRKITPSGIVTTLAGAAGQDGNSNGTGTAARFIYPTSLALDPSGNIFVTDRGNNMIRKITPSGIVTTLVDQLGVYTYPNGNVYYYINVGLASDGAGNIYAGVGSTIQRITPAGAVTTLAGLPGVCGSVDGVGTEAQFNLPWGVAVDSTGIIYVADSNNGAIRKGVLAGPPVITAQPVGQSASSGTNVQFSVSASSAPALTYQWLFNGNALSGATGSSLSLTGVTAANAGDYTVVVSNVIGSVTSNKATLTVGASPVAPPAQGGGGGGGGGAPSLWFLGLISLVAAARRGFLLKK